MNQTSNQKDGPTFIALFFILLAIFGLIGMSAMILPQISALIIVLGGFFFLCAFHYVIWGRLMKIPKDDTPVDEQD